jgi:hypothetical protein
VAAVQRAGIVRFQRRYRHRHLVGRKDLNPRRARPGSMASSKSHYILSSQK